ncbi:hypothetical protein [Bifidobacterium pseudolongum]|uniref:hypothetical protein n=1 Tax=Bifidobacterium pseudolongum TaxID=1694 RepID=UPI00101F8C80|nr:hypothetical protein [Bifidobacterium pseudolongum]
MFIQTRYASPYGVSRPRQPVGARTPTRRPAQHTHSRKAQAPNGTGSLQSPPRWQRMRRRQNIQPMSMLPELELIMVNEFDDLMGYDMFSRFHLEGKYENELLLLSPVVVKMDFQRQHVSKDITESGFQSTAAHYTTPRNMNK